jgi:hypothetical protein
MEQTLTKQDIEALKKPFPTETLGIKVQSLTRAKDRAMLVCYIQHTDVYERIEEVDPAWGGEIISEEWKRQGDEERCFVRYRMTIKGVARENVGDGHDPKGATSDAIKRTGMLFGVGRYLYNSPRAWVPYNEKDDKYRQFTYQDYERGLNGNRPTQSQAKAATPLVATKPIQSTAKGPTITPAEANQLMAECKTRKVDMMAFNAEIKRRGLVRVIDLPADDFAPMTEWVIRNSTKRVDELEVEIEELEKLGINRDQINTYIETMPGKPTGEMVVRNLHSARTGLKLEGLKRMFTDVAAREKVRS